MGQNPGWNFAFNHPYSTGAITGLLSVPAAQAGVSSAAAFGAAAFPGVSLSYAGAQTFAGIVYASLSYDGAARNWRCSR